jgi:hypothetical protein
VANFNRELGDLTAKDAKSAKEEKAGRLAAKSREKTRGEGKERKVATADFADGADEGGGNANDE